MDQAEGNLKVTDRRLFTSEGELRSDPDRSEEASERVQQQSADAVNDAFHANSPRPGAPPRVTLSAFVISLATQAAELLGESKDFEGARQVIGAIEMLQEKTAKNRTDEETKLLDVVLFDLRMAFLKAPKEPVS